MKNRLTATALLAAALFLAAGSIIAQDRKESPDRAERKEALKELRERFHEWAAAEIVPKLSEWKGTLDAAMSPDDLAILNDLRKQAKELRATIRESAAGLRRAWRDEDYDALKKYREQLSDARGKQLDVLDLLTPLAIEYRETLKAIGAEARPYAKRWKEDGTELLQRWAEEYPDHAGAGRRMLARRRPFAGGLLDPEMKKAMRVAFFMLWDGSADATDGADVDELDLR